MTDDLRMRVALPAALATVVLLSVVSALGYVATVNASRRSQINLLNERLDQVEQRLIDGEDSELLRRSQLELSVQVTRSNDPVPEPRPGVLQVVRPTDHPQVSALVGRVSTREIDQTLATVRTALFISVFVVGLLVGAGAWVVVDRALAPVRRLTARARAAEENRSLELLPVTTRGDEIAELATTFNSMITKLRTADSERRRFVSDASHELRTPLMVLTADAEYALDHHPESTELAASVLQQSRQLTALVDDLLTLASIDEGRPADDGAIPVCELLERTGVEEVDRAEPKLHLSTILVPDVSRAVANVVANARRYATSNVEVTFECADESVAVIVDDDGPCVPIDQRTDVFRRQPSGRHDNHRRLTPGRGAVRDHGARLRLTACSRRHPSAQPTRTAARTSPRRVQAAVRIQFVEHRRSAASSSVPAVNREWRGTWINAVEPKATPSSAAATHAAPALIIAGRSTSRASAVMPSTAISGPTTKEIRRW